jgi:hypothetical protein
MPWGFGRVRFAAFVRLAYRLIREAWKQTREVHIGDKLEITVELEV